MARALPTPPAHIIDGVFCQLLPDGRVRVIMVRKRKSVAEITIKPEELSSMLATLANAGTLAQARLVEPLPPAPETVIIEASTIGVVPHPQPNHSALLLSFGKARLAVGLPHEAGLQIGRAMVAAAEAAKSK